MTENVRLIRTVRKSLIKSNRKATPSNTTTGQNGIFSLEYSVRIIQNLSDNPTLVISPTKRGYFRNFTRLQDPQNPNLHRPITYHDRSTAGIACLTVVQKGNSSGWNDWLLSPV